MLNKFSRIIVWFNPQKNDYYYKVMQTYYNPYFKGYKNQFNHEIVLIIDLVYGRKPKNNQVYR